jgi:hypothetical protein
MNISVAKFSVCGDVLTELYVFIRSVQSTTGCQILSGQLTRIRSGSKLAREYWYLMRSFHYSVCTVSLFYVIHHCVNRRRFSFFNFLLGESKCV